MADKEWLKLASLYLDSGTQRFSGGTVRAPAYIYTGSVLDWGGIEKSIPILPGIPHVSDARIRLADTNRHWRDIFTHETGRRRLIDIRIGRAGTSESTDFILIFTGEVVKHSFGPGYVELSLRDRTFSWI